MSTPESAEIPAEAPKPVRPPRDLSLDVGRGALMAYIVIIIHGIYWLRLVDPKSVSWLLFEMPPVFAIAGAAYFHAARAERGPPNYGRYIARRLVRMLVPYFAVALVSAAIVLYFRAQYLTQHGSTMTLGEVGAALLSWINPASRGAGHTMAMLSWHLWFMAPFLLVSAVLPFIAPKGVWAWVRPWMLAIAGAVLILIVHYVQKPPELTTQNTIFYALWAMFGVALAAAPKRFSIRDYAIVLVLALAALFAAFNFNAAQVTLDMQRNKFPPNAVFFLFSCFWMSALLIAARFVTPEHAAKLAKFPPLKPFISAGYSIYLWQGVGYTTAVLIGRPQHWSPFVMWPLAIALTIIFGLIAFPLERIRLGK